MLRGKHVLLGVCGGIAAYKIASLASRLVKDGAEVRVIMTPAAVRFIAPLTFETITHNAVYTDTFHREGNYDVEHVSLAQWADVLLVAPASANTIAKMANGIADNMLTTVYLALNCPVAVAPAMNTAMLEHPATRKNIQTLESRGHVFAHAQEGRLACGESGKGRLADEENLVNVLEYALSVKDFAGKRVLISAGPTQEAIDPVRYITNRSSGKMGYALAQAAYQRGAEVVLVSGVPERSAPQGICVVPVRSAADMERAIMAHADTSDIIIKCAAVADYTPKNPKNIKMKKGDAVTLELVPTTDILMELGQREHTAYLVGFAAETNDVIKYAKEKLYAKNVDMIVANDVSVGTIGFDSDDNAVTIFKKNGEQLVLKADTKINIAGKILDEIKRG